MLECFAMLLHFTTSYYKQWQLFFHQENDGVLVTNCAENLKASKSLTFTEFPWWHQVLFKIHLKNKYLLSDNSTPKNT